MLKPFAAASFVILASVGAVEVLKRTTAPKQPAGPSAPAAQQPRGMTVLREDGQGHFIASTLMNGVVIQTVVDTGASLIALSMEDAARVGIFPNPSDFRVSLATANGSISAAPVRLREVRLGSIRIHDVEAVVLPAGRLKGSLLGMSFLRRLSSFQVENGSLLLRE